MEPTWAGGNWSPGSPSRCSTGAVGSSGEGCSAWRLWGQGHIISLLPCPKAMPRSASNRVKLWIRWHFKAIYILSWQCEFTQSQQTVVKTQTWHRLFSQIQSCPSKTYLVTLFSQSAMDFLLDSTKPKNEGLVPWKDDVSHHTSDFRWLWTRKGSRIWNAITDRKAILVNFF